MSKELNNIDTVIITDGDPESWGLKKKDAPKKLTLKEAQKQAREIGMTIKKNDCDEYVVNVKGGKEATAYYATDLEDALGTAQAEAKWHAKQR